MPVICPLTHSCEDMGWEHPCDRDKGSQPGSKQMCACTCRAVHRSTVLRGHPDVKPRVSFRTRF